MVTRRPLVLDNGLISELLDGDTVDPGEVTTSVVAGSGLSGGGSATSNSRLDLVLAPNPSGVIYVGDSIGLDGQTLVVASDALASGNAAIGVASNALASGNDSLAVASAALASGNSALAISSTFGGSIQTTLIAASAIASGYVVGVDDAGKAQSVRLISTSYTPTLNSYPNALGISQSTVASGSPCLVNLPGSIYNNPDADYTVGAFYYANPTTSGVTTTATKPSSWNGQVPWNYIGRAVTSSGLMLLKSV